MTRLLLLCVHLLVVPFGAYAADEHLAAAAPAQRPFQVLLLSSWFKDMPWHAGFEHGFRDELTSLNRPFRLYVEFLDASRFPNRVARDSVVDLLQQKYGDRKIDLIIAESIPAVRFIDAAPGVLPEAQRVYVQTGARRKVQSDVPTIHGNADFRGAIAEMIRLYDPKEIFVIGDTPIRPGTGPLDAFKAAMAEFSGRVRATYIGDIPVDQILEHFPIL